jgi:formylmethanofuran dehydrogenase subunit E-like metal-binding protein
LGEKLRIAENIIKSLTIMKYNVKVQPIQIQGLDFETIYKILIWLVKKVFETREENKENIKKISELQFSKNYELPEETLKKTKFPSSISYLSTGTLLYNRSQWNI